MTLVMPTSSPLSVIQPASAGESAQFRRGSIADWLPFNEPLIGTTEQDAEKLARFRLCRRLKPALDRK